ncbi:hypothetical protein DL764_008635 [Monosporascus ibericus]|uniref:Uncharacterized protein n=1 Tax=Monosporascus ibericus TaxID=155417 RepID=A0A4Q4SX04_9PEZI|nr:hypothetical protein DL764_008635 [Monosporascus ibericus]
MLQTPKFNLRQRKWLALRREPETKLDTHDIALPLPQAAGQPQRVLCAILLIPTEVGSEATRARLERLYHLNGGRDVAVVFLLKHEDGQESPTATLMRLQQDLIGSFEMPAVPVDSVQAVPTTLFALRRQLINVLTDVTSGFHDMLDKMSNPTGRAQLADYLDMDTEKVISFWSEEYLAE